MIPLHQDPHATAGGARAASSLRLAGPTPLLDRRRVPHWSPAQIDLGAAGWPCPYDLVALATMLARLRSAGRPPAIVTPRDPAVAAYLAGSGIEELDGCGGEPLTPPPEPALVPLQRLDSAEDWDFLLPDLWIAGSELFGEPDLVRSVLEILSELIDNAATHGASEIGTYVCAQRYQPEGPLAPGLWLAVADGGRGIPGHLRLNPKYRGERKDEQLIRLARRPWVTGTRDRRGWGLVQVFEDAAALGFCEAVIRSGAGEGRFLLRRGLPPFARYRSLRPRVPGTIVHLRLALP
jgi:hypothetical protein